MSKKSKQKKTEGGEAKEAWKPRFFNHLTFTWDEWRRWWNATGLVTRFPTNSMHWWVDVSCASIEFEHGLETEFGRIERPWITIKHAENMIEKCLSYPVFVEPDTMFLRRWLDTWVTNNHARIWMHVREFLRLTKRVKETEAEKRATEVGNAYLALFLERPPGKT